MEKLLAFFEYKIQNEGRFENRRRLVFTQISFIVLLALLFFTVSHFAQGKIYSGLIDLIGFILIFFNLFAYKKFGNYKWSMFLFVGTTLTIIAIQHITAPPELQSNTLWFTIFAFGINFILNKKQNKIAFFLVLLIGIISELLHQKSSLNLHEFSNQDSMSINLTSVIISIIASYFIGKIVTKSEHETLKSLDQKNRESIALSEEYSALVTVLGHDLSNQIFIINMHAAKLQRDLSPDDKDADSINMIKKVSDDMATFIKQIKQYKAVEEGKLQIELEKVHPTLAINSSIEYFRDKLNEKNVDLYFVPPRNISSMQAEPVTLVSGVLNNILTNAIKFSNSGSTISINLYEKKDNVIIRITDEGIGIPEEILQNLFNMKKETSRTGTNGEKGTGFGMPILKMYMDKYEGIVEVRSNAVGERTGTSFKLIFKKFS